MKKILSILGLFSLLPILVSASTMTALTGQIETETKAGLGAVYFLLKVGGFGIIIWGIADLMAEEQGQGGGGGKYIKATVKIIVGALFIAGEKLGKALKITS